MTSFFNRLSKFLPVSAGLVGGLFFFLLAMKLTVIRLGGSPMPFADQWGHEGNLLYIPAFEGTLGFRNFVIPVNEHRTLWNRLQELGLVLWSGQWDPLLQMTTNAVLHAAIMTAVCALFYRRFGRQYGLIAGFLVAVVFGIPFSWENTLQGVASHHYFLFGFSFLTIAFLVLRNTTGWAIGGGILAGISSIFTMGSGWLAALACLPVLLFGAWRFKRRPGPEAGRLAVALVVALIGVKLIVFVPAHAVLRAHSPMDFIWTALTAAAWPNGVFPLLAVLMWLPFLGHLYMYWVRRKEADRADEFLTALGIWLLLQCATIGFARGASRLVPSRYFDLLAFQVVVNAMCLVRLYDWTAVHAEVPRFFLKPAMAAWAVFFAVGGANLASFTLMADIPEWERMQAKQVATIRSFLVTDDPEKINSKTREEIPYHDNPELIGYLRHPYILSILPAEVRKPVQVLTAPKTSEGFKGLEALSLKGDPAEWRGGLTDRGASGPSRFEGSPVNPPKLPFLVVTVAGSLGAPGTTAKFVAASDGRTLADLRPPRPVGNRWTNVVIPTPREGFRLVLENTSGSWFAVAQPLELSAPGKLARRTLGVGGLLCFFASGFFLVIGLRNGLRLETEQGDEHSSH
jgi:hypothetical protein